MARRPAVFSAAPSPPSQSPTPLPNVFSVCCFGSAYVPACILLKGDLMVLILLLLFHVDLFTYRGLFFFLLRVTSWAAGYTSAAAGNQTGAISITG